MANISESLDMIATTLDAWLPEAPDAIINNNGALYYFKKFGKMGLKGENNEPMGSIETLDGGKRISVDVKIVANPNVGNVYSIRFVQNYMKFYSTHKASHYYKLYSLITNINYFIDTLISLPREFLQL